MAKLTVLDMVQSILSDLSSDNVNTTGQTIESQRVTQLLKTTYFKLMAARNWPHLRKLSQLQGLGDTTNPTRMSIPTAVDRIEHIKYNRQVSTGSFVRMEHIQYLTPEDFVDFLDSRIDTSSANIQTVTDPASGVLLRIRNDLPPIYWTSFDDEFVYFDSWVQVLEATMTSVNNSIMAYRYPVWGNTLVLSDWVALTLQAQDSQVTPTVNNAGGYTFTAQYGSGTTGAGPVTWPQAYGTSVVDGTVTWVNTGLGLDSFIPDLPVQEFPYLLSEATASCFNKIKQVQDTMELVDSKRQRVASQLQKAKVAEKVVPIGYGRNGAKSLSSSRISRANRGGN